MAIGGKRGLRRAGGLVGAVGIVAGTGVAAGLFVTPAYAGSTELDCIVRGNGVGSKVVATLSADDPADVTVGDEVTFTGITFDFSFDPGFAAGQSPNHLNGTLDDIPVQAGDQLLSIPGTAFGFDLDDQGRGSASVPLDDVTVTATTAGELSLGLPPTSPPDHQITGEITLINPGGIEHTRPFRCDGGETVSTVGVGDGDNPPDDGGDNPPGDGGDNPPGDGGDNPPGDNGGGDEGNGGDDGNGAPAPGSDGDDDGGNLANTGASGVVPMTIGGIALVAAGSGLMYGLRRKHRAAHAAE